LPLSSGRRQSKRMLAKSPEVAVEPIQMLFTGPGCGRTACTHVWPPTTARRGVSQVFECVPSTTQGQRGWSPFTRALSRLCALLSEAHARPRRRARPPPPHPMPTPAHARRRRSP
jgi:hypothetical protein